MRNPKPKTPQIDRPALRSDSKKLSQTTQILKIEDSSDGKLSRSKQQSKMARKSCKRIMVSKRRRVEVDNQNDQVSKGFFDYTLDIISEILSRLPIEAILRCRSVCKTWYGLTKNPGFISMQLNRSCNQPSRFISHPLSATYTRVLEYPFYVLQSTPLAEGSHANSLFLLDTDEGKARKIHLKEMLLPPLRIMCSCNGLLCIAADDSLNPVFICNPITDEVVLLPLSVSVLDLLFHQVGLCFQASSRKYIVVRAYRYMNKQDEVTSFEILASGERSWRKLSPPQGIGECEIWRAIFWNNAVHWRISRKVDKSGRECILSFDANDEKFQMISFPDTVEACERNLELLVLNGRLTLIELEDNMMKLWEVTGNEVGTFSLNCHQIYDTHVKWGGLFHCSLLSRLTHNEHLLKVSYSTTAPTSLRSHFVGSSHEMTQYKPLEIPGLPVHFETFSYNPSLVSPGSLCLPCIERRGKSVT